MIIWKRIQRQGFIAAHWVGYVGDVERFKIEQRKPINAGRLHNTRVAYLRTNGGYVPRTFPTVEAAKTHAWEITLVERRQ